MMTTPSNDSLREALQLAREQVAAIDNKHEKVSSVMVNLDLLRYLLATETQPAHFSAEQVREIYDQTYDGKPVNFWKDFADRLNALLGAAPPADKGAMRILESLTPTGSEFVGDPEACAAYVRKKISTLHDVAKNAVLRSQQREADVSNAARLEGEKAAYEEVRNSAAELEDTALVAWSNERIAQADRKIAALKSASAKPDPMDGTRETSSGDKRL